MYAPGQGCLWDTGPYCGLSPGGPSSRPSRPSVIPPHDAVLERLLRSFLLGISTTPTTRQGHLQEKEHEAVR